MAEITERPRIDLRLSFTVNEEEARALDALAGYGSDAFVKAFYETLGKAYMERHENGLRTFLNSIREFVPHALGRIDKARKEFENPTRK